MTFSMGGLRGALPQPAARRRAPTAPPLRAAPLPGYDGLRRGGGLQAEPGA